MELTLKNTKTFLEGRPEFLGQLIRSLSIRPQTMQNSVVSPSDFSTDYARFKTDQGMLNSDGFPRFVYFGMIDILDDQNKLDLSYRGHPVYTGSNVAERSSKTTPFLFDSSDEGAGVPDDISWIFNGFVIDRGA